MKNKKILLGVSGSIAAYKIPLLVRLFKKAGAEVRVVLTEAASKFVSPLVLSTLAQTEVLSEVSEGASWSNHIELGLWADIFLIAPASANTLAKLANGICDNMLTAVYLACRCPVLVSPAMDVDMWAHPATQANAQKLATFPRHRLIEPASGELASGLVGAGRMPEPETLFELVKNQLSGKTFPLSGKNLLITSGATIEPIDPVRYISNHSTGKMGVALAEAALAQGARVILVTGTHAVLPAPHERLEIIKIQSAQDMYEAVQAQFSKIDIGIWAAAVADYTPAVVSDIKIKKNDPTFAIQLKKTLDIASEMGKLKQPNQFLVGFALETNDAIAHAQRKLGSKNLDFIVLNTLEDAGAGFGHDTNKTNLIFRDGHMEVLPLLSKKLVAEHIVSAIIQKIAQNS